MSTSTVKPPKKPAKTSKKVVPIGNNEGHQPPETGPEQEELPPDDVPPIAATPRMNPKPFPIPPKAILKGGFCDATAGMDYWRSIPEEFKTRLTVYINREHPVLNRLQECTEEDIALMRVHKKRYPIKYIDLPPEPFGPDTDMQFLNRYGSGKYKVFINDVGITGAKEPDLQSRNLCKFLIKVYDSDFPPILDPSRPDKGLGVLDWFHPDNQSYVAELRTKGILPPGERAGDSVADSVVKTLVDKVTDLSDRVGVQETDRLVDRIVERVGTGNKTSDFVETIKGVKEILGPANGKPAEEKTDPWAAAERILSMRSDNPMVEILKQQMIDTNRAIEAERQRQFDAAEKAKEREAALQAELRRTMQPAAAPKGLVDQIVELASVAEKLEPLKKLFGGGAGSNGTGTAAVTESRSHRMGTLEFLSQTLPTILDSPLASAAAQLVMSLANRSQATATTAGNPAAPQVGATPMADPFQKFLTETATPVMLNYFIQGSTGEDFADWVYAAWPRYLPRMQNFSHPLIPGQRGAPAIIAAFRNIPNVWSRIAGQEQEFSAFVYEFCAFKPDAEEGDDDDAQDVEARTVTADEDGWEQPAEAHA